jgi:hypothetical protein
LNLSLKRLAVIAIAISAVAIGLGLLIDFDGFVDNLLAETAGILLGAVLAVRIIDRAVDHDRARRWELVAVQTLDTLRFVVIRAGMDVYLLLPAPRPGDADPYIFGNADDGRMLPKSLHKLADVVRAEMPLLDEGEIVRKLKDHLQVVRGGVLPQLLAIGTHDLIARLATLEATFQELENTAWLEQRFGGLNQFNQELADLVSALAGVSEEINRSGATVE